MTVTDARQDLRLAIRNALKTHADRDARRRYVDDGAAHDDALWKLLATQLGIQGIAIEEDHGGAGASLSELAVVMEETGAQLLCAPLLASTIMATTAIQRSEDSRAARELLPSLADGTRVATLAYRADSRDPPSAMLSAYGGWDVSGTTVNVLDGAAADTLLVLAATRTGPVLLAVDADQTQRHALPPLDPTRRLANIRFAGSSGRIVGRPAAGRRIVADTLESARVMLCAEQVGGAHQILQLTIEYALSREQFERPIGSFQAIKHRIADMYVAVEKARAVTEETLTAHLADEKAAAQMIHATCALVADAYLTVTKSALQVFGGIGYTWEHDAHLYLKRALGSARLFGTPTHHRNMIATSFGL